MSLTSENPKTQQNIPNKNDQEPINIKKKKH